MFSEFFLSSIPIYHRIQPLFSGHPQGPPILRSGARCGHHFGPKGQRLERQQLRDLGGAIAGSPGPDVFGLPFGKLTVCY